MLLKQFTGQAVTQTMQLKRLAELVTEQGAQSAALERQRRIAETTIWMEWAAS